MHVPGLSQMTDLLGGYWWLLLGLVLAVLLALLSMAFRGRSESGWTTRVARAFLVWPLLLDREEQKGSRLGWLIAVMLAIAALAIWLTPPSR